LIVGIGVCLLLLALLSAVDTAFTSISWHRLQAMLAERATRSRPLARLIQDPARFKATLLLLHTSTAVIAAALLLHLTSGLTVWQQIGSLLLLVLLNLVVGVALARVLVARNPQAVVLALAGPVSRMVWLFGPLIALSTLLARPLVRLTGGSETERPAPPLVIEEELRSLVDAGEEEGVFEHDEREMLESVFSFTETIVREVMVPRVDILALEVSSSLDEALDLVIREGHSRIPVYEETIDHIVGILYAKDLLPALRHGQFDRELVSLLRPVHLVPETLNTDVLLKELQQARVHMAIVVDEYGGTAGLVTLEDLVEEIVGEIQDEYDDEEPLIEVLSDTEMIVDARASLEEINDYIAFAPPTSGTERVGGLVYEHLGRMPRVGDEIALDDVVLTVLSMKGVRPQKLRLELRRVPELHYVPLPQPATAPAPQQQGAPGLAVPFFTAPDLLNARRGTTHAARSTDLSGTP
jgi:CBS domain containing-hemolysin-like protein